MNIFFLREHIIYVFKKKYKLMMNFSLSFFYMGISASD